VALAVRRQPSRGAPLNEIDGTTRLVGIIGDPVAHSLSPAIQNAAFASLGINMVYVAMPVVAVHLGDALHGLSALGFRGVNVTMPHKAAVIPFLTEIDDQAALAEAVNTIVVEPGSLIGYNTDVGGFSGALREYVPEGVAGASALVVGAGGVARAVVLALLAEKVCAITVANRTPEKAERLVRRFGGAAGSALLGGCALADLSAQAVREADLVVNATALGMQGGGKVPVVLTDNIRKDHVVVDVVYAKRATQLVEIARARQARGIDGQAMLVWQAALAFERWTQRSAPVDVMRSVVRTR
jgi:shikimate dehydrogenase